jgi:hypothetical protein
MTWNLMHLARLINDAGSFPAHGNQRSEWEAVASITPFQSSASRPSAHLSLDA